MMTAKLLGTTSLNKLRDDFNWPDVEFNKTAEFVEMMSANLIDDKTTKSKPAVRISKEFHEKDERRIYS